MDCSSQRRVEISRQSASGWQVYTVAMRAYSAILFLLLSRRCLSQVGPILVQFQTPSATPTPSAGSLGAAQTSTTFPVQFSLQVCDSSPMVAEPSERMNILSCIAVAQRKCSPGVCDVIGLPASCHATSVVESLLEPDSSDELELCSHKRRWPVGWRIASRRCSGESVGPNHTGAVYVAAAVFRFAGTGFS